MIISPASLGAAFIGFKTAFNDGFAGAPSVYKEIATVVPSSTAEEHYGWIGQFPGVREWIGPRHVKNLMAHGYIIKNKRFELTISVPRESIEDDRIGLFKAPMEGLGRSAGEHADQLVLGLLKEGFTAACYDGQPFFDAEHPVSDGAAPPTLVSNVQSGDGPPWFLLNTNLTMRPLIYQERIPYNFTRLDRDSDNNVFFNDEYVYGTRGRANAGFGFWQLAFASKAPLTAANYEAARVAMSEFIGEEGRPLGVRPNILVAPPSLEGAAMRLLNNGTRVEVVSDTPVAIQNEWAGTAKLIVTPWVA